jgi:hypothetical protein
MLNTDPRSATTSRPWRTPRRTSALLVLFALACGGSKAPEPIPAAAAASTPTQLEVDRLKALEEAAARAKAERKKRRDLMRAMGTATVTKKKQLGAGKDVKIELEFEFKNVGTKELSSADGALEIRDASGEVLKSLKLPFLGPIKPGASVKKTGKFPADPGKPGDVTLVKTPLKDLQLNWVPQFYRFTDGTSERGE